MPAADRQVLLAQLSGNEHEYACLHRASAISSQTPPLTTIFVLAGGWLALPDDMSAYHLDPKFLTSRDQVLCCWKLLFNDEFSGFKAQYTRGDRWQAIGRHLENWRQEWWHLGRIKGGYTLWNFTMPWHTNLDKALLKCRKMLTSFRTPTNILRTWQIADSQKSYYCQCYYFIISSNFIIHRFSCLAQSSIFTSKWGEGRIPWSKRWKKCRIWNQIDSAWGEILASFCGTLDNPNFLSFRCPFHKTDWLQVLLRQLSCVSIILWLPEKKNNQI